MTLHARPLRLSTAQADFDAAFQARLHWSADTNAEIEQRVADILADVQTRGDAAVMDYTQRFDGLGVQSMAELELGADTLRAAFEGLPTDQREAVLLVMVEGYSYKEAAEIIGCPVGTLNSRLVRGRDALLGLLEDAS